MHIVLISGSHRQNSQSRRITQHLMTRVAALDAGITSDIIDLTGNPLPLWDDVFWKPGSDLQKQWEPYRKRLAAADGLVVVSPEWSGMCPSGLKNFFLYCSAKEVGHKPAMIVGVSSSMGGTYPVNELRTSSYKNARICYIPDHLIIHNAESIFIGKTPTSKDDKYLRERADYALRILVEYMKALKSVRDSGVTFDKKYAFGM
jgi:NAD(P)H-dependent FMN reductase